MTEHEDLLDTSRRMVTREANRSHRLSVVVIALLASFGGYMTSLHASDDGAMGRAQASNIALQKKSAEQTIAEVQLRDDVNSFRALNKSLRSNHTSAVAVYCSIAQSLIPPDTLPPVAKYCPQPKGTP